MHTSNKTMEQNASGDAHCTKATVEMACCLHRHCKRLAAGAFYAFKGHRNLHHQQVPEAADSEKTT